MSNTDYGEGLTIRDLLLEVRADIRSIDIKLEGKADRTRVHELANELNVIKLERATEKRLTEILPDHETRLRGLERFRYAIPSVAVLGFIVTAITAVFTFAH